MAKALFGHTSPFPDVRLLDEVGRMRRRVAELERELAEARGESVRLAGALQRAELQRAELQRAELQTAELQTAELQMDDRDLFRLSRLEHASI